MTTPDTDPLDTDQERDLEHVYEEDLTQLQDAECSSCLGSRVTYVMDADHPLAVACASCADVGEHRREVVGERITQRVMRVAPAQICAIVEPELESARSTPGEPRLSPIASLARLATEYLEAERAFRRAEVRALIVGRERAGYDRRLVVVVQAELDLRRACGLGSPDSAWSSELHHSDLLEIIGNIPGADVSGAEVGPHAIDLLSSLPRFPGPRRRLGTWARLSTWTRGALFRLRRGWDPR